ncbi:MAG: ComF family protein [Pseudomonadota bacterium]
MGLNKTLIRTFAELALPPRCPACGVSVARDHEICLDCWRQYAFLAGPKCIRCGEPFAFDRGPDTICGQCLANPPHFDSVRAAVRYDELSARLVIRLKYGGRLGIADLISGHMERLITEQDVPELIIPVPLHRTRLWRRGFNQSALIAQVIGRRLRCTVASDLLIRTHATPPLKKMSTAQRFETVRNAFDVTAKGRSELPGKEILLVDDVFTSGSTANACAGVLKAAGTKKVTVLCWARVCLTED